jgi:hypothetical protein
MKIVLFSVIGIISVIIGGHLAAYFFFGVITLVGFIALIESISMLKWIVIRTSGLIDVIIFVTTIIATASFGITITASLTVAGLGFTLLYAPWLRSNHYKSKSNNRYKSHLKGPKVSKDENVRF